MTFQRSTVDPFAVVESGRDCHSLVRRPSGTDFEDVWPAVLDALPRAGSPRLWRVRTGEPAAGAGAAEHRERERRRPLAPGAVLRAVHLGHADGGEVVLVARRGAVPLCCLDAIADVLCAAPAQRPAVLRAWQEHRNAAGHAPLRPPGAVRTGSGAVRVEEWEIPAPASAARTGDLVTTAGAVLA